MCKLTDKEIEGFLVNIISDGFNRSLSSLVKAGAIDLKKMQSEYTGIGSRYYDLVTEQITYTAKMAAPSLKQLIENKIDLAT